jgi:hypothetical protein
MGRDVEWLEKTMSAVEQLPDDVADTVRLVLGRRAPDLLRALEATDDPATKLRQQVKNVLAKEFVSKDGLQSDHEPTAMANGWTTPSAPLSCISPSNGRTAVAEGPMSDRGTPVPDRESRARFSCGVWRIGSTSPSLVST